MNHFCGLYAIADTSLIPADQLLGRVSQAIEGGARIIQYRDKNTDSALKLAQATRLQELCSQHNVLFIVNDDVELSRQSGADGVHLGVDDASITHARSVLGSQSTIGISCYNQWQQALTASEEGADYIAFGRFFSSQTKPDTVLADVQLLRDARQSLSVPVVAIGGITPENGSALIEAGTHMIAAVHGVFGSADIKASARQYTQLFHCN